MAAAGSEAEHLQIVSARITSRLSEHTPIPTGGYALYYFIESHALLTVGKTQRTCSAGMSPCFPPMPITIFSAAATSCAK